MYRAVFLACGVYVMLAGSCFFLVDEITLSTKISERAQPILSVVGSADERGRIRLHPAEWIPYTLMGLGLVTVLYGIALPKD